MTGVRARLARAEGVVGVGLGLLLGVLVAVEPRLAVVAIAGVAVVGLGLLWPPLLVALMFLGMFFDRLGVTGAKVADFPVTASKLSVLLGVGLWIVHSGLTTARIVRWHAVLTSMLGVIGTTAVCIAWANSMTAGKFTLFGLVMMTVMVALVYAVLAEARLDGLYRFLTVVLLAALVTAVLRPNVEGADGRVSGPMGDPNEWATTVLLLTPLLMGGLVDDTHPLARPLRMALFLLAPLGVLRSESRAALVVLGVVGPACVYLLRERRGEMLVCGGAAAVAAPIVLDLPTALGRFWQLLDAFQGKAAVRDQSFEERSELFRQAVQLFKDHWFLGAGPGNFETATGFVSHTGDLRPAHNTYLEIASEQGIVGLIPVCVFLGVVASSVHAGWRDAGTRRDRDRIFGAAVGLGSFALMAATLGLLTFAMGYFVLGFTLALLHQARGADVGAG